MAKDILIDDIGDLVIENGDFKIGNSDQQHYVLLINTFLGSWKGHPLAGIGVINYSASSGQGQVLKREIVDQGLRDGFINVQVGLEENENDQFDANITAERLD